VSAYLGLPWSPGTTRRGQRVKIPPRPPHASPPSAKPTLKASNEDLVKAFYGLQSREDVAALLELRHDHLVYHLFRVPPMSRYTSFAIPKRTGGSRTILAPASALKLIQHKLAHILALVYEHQYGPRRPSVHGFRPGRSIVSNAANHIRRPWVLRVDLQDFFPTISFPRVYGVFLSEPFGLGKSAATALAQICTFQNQLPQGAPTSPAISNLICARMDRELQKVARSVSGLRYTRYADDLVFSSWTSLPASIVSIKNDSISAGYAVDAVLQGNWFRANPKKTKLLRRADARHVTGLLVNSKVNVHRKFVRRVRSMLRLWKKHGLKGMQEHFTNHHDKKWRGPKRSPASFKRMVRGRIEFIGQVRGKHDRIYLNLLWHFRVLSERSPNHATLKYLTELLSEFSSDDSDRVQRCYGVRDALARVLHGESAACSAIGVSKAQWSRLGLLANGQPIFGTRHPGSFDVSAMREMTPAERTEIESIARAMRDGFASFLAKSQTMAGA
jgi:RNA-directed DNA polymerase